MAIQVRFGGAWRTITGAQVYAGGAWHPLVAAQVYDGGAWRKVGNFVPPPSGSGGTIGVSVSPSSFNVTSIGPRPQSPTMTATPAGGVAPYSYSRSIISADVSMAFSAPTLASTDVHTSASLTDGQTVSCTVRCTVTDSLGSSGHADVSGTLTYNSSSGTA